MSFPIEIDPTKTPKPDPVWDGDRVTPQGNGQHIPESPACQEWWDALIEADSVKGIATLVYLMSSDPEPETAQSLLDLACIILPPNKSTVLAWNQAAGRIGIPAVMGGQNDITH